MNTQQSNNTHTHLPAIVMVFTLPWAITPLIYITLTASHQCTASRGQETEINKCWKTVDYRQME